MKNQNRQETQKYVFLALLLFFTFSIFILFFKIIIAVNFTGELTPQQISDIKDNPEMLASYSPEERAKILAYYSTGDNKDQEMINAFPREEFIEALNTEDGAKLIVPANEAVWNRLEEEIAKDPRFLNGATKTQNIITAGLASDKSDNPEIRKAWLKGKGLKDEDENKVARILNYDGETGKLWIDGKNGGKIDTQAIAESGAQVQLNKDGSITQVDGSGQVVGPTLSGGGSGEISIKLNDGKLIYSVSGKEAEIDFSKIKADLLKPDMEIIAQQGAKVRTAKEVYSPLGSADFKIARSSGGKFKVTGGEDGYEVYDPSLKKKIAEVYGTVRKQNLDDNGGDLQPGGKVVFYRSYTTSDQTGVYYHNVKGPVIETPTDGAEVSFLSSSKSADMPAKTSLTSGKSIVAYNPETQQIAANIGSESKLDIYGIENRKIAVNYLDDSKGQVRIMQVDSRGSPIPGSATTITQGVGGKGIVTGDKEYLLNDLDATFKSPDGKNERTYHMEYNTAGRNEIFVTDNGKPRYVSSWYGNQKGIAAKRYPIETAPEASPAEPRVEPALTKTIQENTRKNIVAKITQLNSVNRNFVITPKKGATGFDINGINQQITQIVQLMEGLGVTPVQIKAEAERKCREKGLVYNENTKRCKEK